jgi:hypothetical protein
VFCCQAARREQIAVWRLNLFEIALATSLNPLQNEANRHCGQPLLVDVFIAFVARSAAAFFDAKLVKLAVDRQSAW